MEGFAMRLLALTLSFAVLVCSSSARAQSEATPDEMIAYGEAPSQRIEAFLPVPDGPTPVVVFISGGCYVTRYGGPAQVRPVLAELRDQGVAVWSVGYRRSDEGGTFPNMFTDVATAIDRLKTEGPRLGLDLSRIVFVGHSAGGHLALWAAGRSRIPVSSPLHADDPVRPIGLVAVAAPGDIAPLRQIADQECGPGVFDAVVGMPSEARPDVFADTSPSRLVPYGIPVRLIDGSDDDVVPPFIMAAFEGQARNAGDDVALEIVPSADHIDVITPGEPGWEAVKRATLALLTLSVSE